MTRSRVIISFIPLSMALLAALSLTACVEVSAIRVIPSTVSTNQIETHSEQVASVKGWVSVANYIPAHGSKLIVTLYMKYKGQKLVVAEQVYQNSHLPVRYFFSIAPIQSGQGAMLVEAKLEVDGRTKGITSSNYVYRLGVTELDLIF